MALLSPNRSILAGGDSVSSSLTINHPVIQGTTPYFFEDYVLTGVTASRPVRIVLDSPSLSGYLEVLNAATGDVVADSNDFSADETTYLSFFPVAGISYVVRVSSTAFGPKTGTFTLRTLAPFTPPLIGALALGGNVVNGSLSAADAQDPLSNKYSQDYELTGLTAAVPVQVTLTGGDDFDTVVEIINKATGELIGFDDENAGGGSARYTFVPSAGITYLARATSYSAGSTGSFILSSALATGTVDLQTLSATAPAEARLGSTISLSWTVKNNGTTSLQGFWGDAVLLSLDQRQDRHDILIEDAQAYIDTLPEPGGIYTRTFSQTIKPPDEVVPGNYYLLFIADAYHYIGESNETNNQIALPFTLQAPDPPELTIASATAPSSSSVGGTLNLSWTVMNSGATAATAYWYDAIYLSSDASFDAGIDTLIDSFSAADSSPLAAGGSYTLAKTISLPGNSTAGDYFLIIKADDSSNQDELSETNNTISLPIAIGLAYTPGPITLNGVNLGSNALGYALRSGTAAPIQISYPGGNASAANPGNGWSAIAAAPASGAGFSLYWRNSLSNQFARWTLDPAGALSGGGLLSIAELLSAESSLNLDLNTDGAIGLAYTPGPITLNGLNLGSNALGYALRSGTAAPIQISYPGGNASAANPGNGWSAIAAAPASGAGFSLYWRNSLSNQFARWTLDPAGALSGGGLLSLTDLYAAENELGFDLNRDGGIGLTFTPTPSSTTTLYNGTFASVNEIDSYSIDIAPGTIISASVTIPNQQNLFPLIDLVDSNNNLLKGSVSYDKDFAELGMYDLITGKAVVNVRTQTGLPGNYELRLSFINREAYKNEVLTLTNAQRLQAGLDPLVRNSLLDTSAQAHVADMDASNKYLAHTGSNGSDPVTRIAATGYKGGWVDLGNGQLRTISSENAASGQKTPSEVVNAWMNSPGHRAAILDPYTKEIGIGFEFDNEVGDIPGQNYKIGTTYWIQNFGHPWQPGMQVWF